LTPLYEQYKDRGFEIICFPCNQFGGQEPGSPAEIREFVSRFNAAYTFTEKVDVNGPAAHPVFLFLRARLSGIFGSSIKWNFTKYLCNRAGLPVQRFAPTTSPSKLAPYIEELLGPQA